MSARLIGRPQRWPATVSFPPACPILHLYQFSSSFPTWCVSPPSSPRATHYRAPSTIPSHIIVSVLSLCAFLWSDFRWLQRACLRMLRSLAKALHNSSQRLLPTCTRHTSPNRSIANVEACYHTIECPRDVPLCHVHRPREPWVLRVG